MSVSYLVCWSVDLLVCLAAGLLICVFNDQTISVITRGILLQLKVSTMYLRLVSAAVKNFAWPTVKWHNLRQHGKTLLPLPRRASIELNIGMRVRARSVSATGS